MAKIAKKMKNHRFGWNYFASHYICCVAANIGCGSEMNAKKIIFCFAFLSPFTIFGFAEYRMRLGNERKKNNFLLCISLAFHHIWLRRI